MGVDLLRHRRRLGHEKFWNRGVRKLFRAVCTRAVLGPHVSVSVSVSASVSASVCLFLSFSFSFPFFLSEKKNS